MTIDLTRRGILAAGAATLIAPVALPATPARAATASASRSSLLDNVLQAHGGLAAWQTVKRIEAQIVAGGPVFQLKQSPVNLQNVTLRADPRAVSVEVSPYPKPGYRGIYTPQRVWIEDDNGRVVAQRSGVFQVLQSQAPTDPWDTLDELCFIGYATFEYLTLPFLLAEPDVQVQEVAPHTEYGSTPWRALRAVFPVRIPTHSTVQTFYFDDTFRLRRFDFHDIGSEAAAYYFDPVTVEGITSYSLLRIVADTSPTPLFSSSTNVLVQFSKIQYLQT
ncbi:hypothetical protein [Burkholderia gladioli]|uniref:hypothetical protein n=1 Tax=Burkholderia gladioli TaxID=28095 RepID=UPI0016422533|nr:hypothetical protein [Burkholderia gladioli]MBJ9679011.1 hypothetical protein [Burkholderia gladioli]